MCIVSVEEKCAKKMSNFKRFPATHPNLFFLLPTQIDAFSYPPVQYVWPCDSASDMRVEVLGTIFIPGP